MSYTVFENHLKCLIIQASWGYFQTRVLWIFAPKTNFQHMNEKDMNWWCSKQTWTVCHSNIMFSLMGHFCWFLNSVVYYVPAFRNRPSARMQFHHPVVKKSWLVYHLDLFSRADALIGDFSSALLLPPIFLFPLTNVSVSSHRIF